MIRSRNPRIDVDELERRIDAELAADPDTPNSDERLARLAATVHARAIEAQLNFAEQRSTPRATWPVDLRVPLISSSERLKNAILKIMSLAFRDQYEANNALIRSQREMLALVHTLLERIDTLESRLETERATTRAQRIANRVPTVLQVAADSPRVSSDSPRVSSDSPRVSRDSPRVSSDSPRVSSDSPRVSSDSPRVSSDSPRVIPSEVEGPTATRQTKKIQPVTSEAEGPPPSCD